MKKILTNLLVLFLVLGTLIISPAKDVQAAGTLQNLKIDSNGVVTWDAYPGADSYDVAVNGDVVVTNYADDYEPTRFDLRSYLLYNCGDEGYYNIEVIAWKEPVGNSTIWEFLANGKITDYLYTAPNGKMPAPGSAWWDGTKARWGTVPNANQYFIQLYRNGSLNAELIVTATTETDLSLYLAGPDKSFEFRVSAGAWGYAKSDYTKSGLRYGIEPTYQRISGKNRYHTSLAIAGEIAAVNDYSGGTYAAVIATGSNFPDALSGAYLAAVNGAPLLLISEGSAEDVCSFVKNNVEYGGRILILGGTGAVPDEWIAPLRNIYTNVTRIAGKTRYDTNLDILRAAGVTDRETILVCTAKNFADSLSASSLPYPILLVGDTLNDNQRAFLSNEAKGSRFYIIGGTGAVSEAVEKELGNYGAVMDRIYGKSRYETSSQVAHYFNCDAKQAVLATGKDFPDGLSGGPLGHLFMAPVLLVDPKGDNSYAKEFVSYAGVSHAYVLGGEAAVATAAVEDILGLGPKMEPGTYVKVVISEQTLYYVKDGKLVLSSPIVSGYGDTLLDELTYYVQYKKEGATLKGKDYTEYVDYWIGFGKPGHYSDGGHILGIHDASWRSQFGGDIYKSDPSHGCINMPADKQKQLYEAVSIGTEVRVIY